MTIHTHDIYINGALKWSDKFTELGGILYNHWIFMIVSNGVRVTPVQHLQYNNINKMIRVP